MYDEAAVKLKGGFAKLNFPEPGSGEPSAAHSVRNVQGALFATL